MRDALKMRTILAILLTVALIIAATHAMVIKGRSSRASIQNSPSLKSSFNAYNVGAGISQGFDGYFWDSIGSVTVKKVTDVARVKFLTTGHLRIVRSYFVKEDSAGNWANGNSNGSTYPARWISKTSHRLPNLQVTLDPTPYEYELVLEGYAAPHSGPSGIFGFEVFTNRGMVGGIFPRYSFVDCGGLGNPFDLSVERRCSSYESILDSKISKARPKWVYSLSS